MARSSSRSRLGSRRSARRSISSSRWSSSRCACMETYSPDAMEKAPAIRPAKPVSRTMPAPGSPRPRRGSATHSSPGRRSCRRPPLGRRRTARRGAMALGLCVVEVVHVLIVATRHRGPLRRWQNAVVANVKWFDQSQPQTLQGAVIFCYLNAAFGVLYFLRGAPLSAILILLGVAAYFIATSGVGPTGRGGDRRPVPRTAAARVFTFQHSFSGILNLVFAAILLALLLHHRAAPTRRSGSTEPCGAPLGVSLSNLARQVAPRPAHQGDRGATDETGPAAQAPNPGVGHAARSVGHVSRAGP